MNENTILFLTEWFKRCPEGGFLEIRIKRDFVTSEFFDNIDDALVFVGGVKDAPKQNVWFGAQPRFKLTEAERLKYFRIEHKSKSRLDEDSPDFEKTLLENYGELGGSKHYIKYAICRQLDFDCVECDSSTCATDENYERMKHWAGIVSVFIEDEEQSGFIIGSGNGIQLFLWMKKPKNIEISQTKEKFEKQIIEVADKILSNCPNPLVEHDTQTSEIAVGFMVITSIIWIPLWVLGYLIRKAQERCEDGNK